MLELGNLSGVGKLRQNSIFFSEIRFSKMADKKAHMQVSHNDLIKLVPSVKKYQLSHK